MEQVLGLFQGILNPRSLPGGKETADRDGPSQASLAVGGSFQVFPGMPHPGSFLGGKGGQRRRFLNLTCCGQLLACVQGFLTLGLAKKKKREKEKENQSAPS